MAGYAYLMCAIILELVGTSFLKLSKGFTNIYYTFTCLSAYALCFFCLSKSLNSLNLSIAYATWCALGIVLATAISIFVFQESLSPAGILGMILVVIGVVIINLFGVPH